MPHGMVRPVASTAGVPSRAGVPPVAPAEALGDGVEVPAVADPVALGAGVVGACCDEDAGGADEHAARATAVDRLRTTARTAVLRAGRAVVLRDPCTCSRVRAGCRGGSAALPCRACPSSPSGPRPLPQPPRRGAVRW